MTDVDDFTGVSAGATTLVASGAVNADAGGHFSITAGAIPTTTRALLLLVTPTNTTGPSETYSVPVATGNISSQRWQPILGVDAWKQEGSGTGFVTLGRAMPPVYFPFYGLVDTAVTVTWTASPGGGAADAVQYWILALPDAAIAGSDLSPLSVSNYADPGTGTALPLNVSLFLSNSNTPIGVDVSPLYVSERDPDPHTAHSVFTAAAATNTVVNLIPAPGGLQVTEVVLIHLASNTTAASATTEGIAQIAGNPIVRAYAGAAGLVADFQGSFLTTQAVDIRNLGLTPTLAGTALARTLSLV